MWFKFLNIKKNDCVLVMCALFPITLCGFWKNLSGHFARFACNHSYGYAFRQFAQTDSLSFSQKSTFL
jgi:hypothetical protein